MRLSLIFFLVHFFFVLFCFLFFIFIFLFLFFYKERFIGVLGSAILIFFCRGLTMIGDIFTQPPPP